MNTGLLCVVSLSICSSLVAQQVQQNSSAASANATGGQVNSASADQTPPAPPQPHTLMDGTPVKLRLSQTISSADAKVGQEVPFEVVEDVKVDDVVILPKGGVAIASVTEAEHRKSMGRGGKLNININYARLNDQEKIALRAVKEARGGGHTAAMTTGIVATAIVFFPAAPLFLFVHGKDITIPQGTEITAFADGDMHLDMSRFGVKPFTPAAAPALTQASVVVESTPPGADISVDGSFTGNTPSTLSLAPGSHEITVTKVGFADWTRKMNITGGVIRVAAELQPAAPTPAAAPATSESTPPSGPANE